MVLPDVDESEESSSDKRLLIGEFGDLDTIAIVGHEIAQLADDEVQIEVFAAGLNFRDILFALGALPGNEDSSAMIGGECSGRILELGKNVEGFEVGDEVIAVARGAAASRTNVDARLVVHKPANLSFEEAAGVPIAYLTAEYALNHLGHLAEGERILIHAATGGVGLAAIQLAQNLGAEIYATAGSEKKRAYLSDLGVEHVMDSRSLKFASSIKEITDDSGVDVVLNSLAGEFLLAGLDLLRPMGRFLEIGKRDIYSDFKIGLFPFRKNLTFHAIDLEPLIQNKHPLITRMLTELVARFEDGTLKPNPTLSVPWERATQAFEHMASARHIGKVVLVMSDALKQFRELEMVSKEESLLIPLQQGLDIFQELLTDAGGSAHVVCTPRAWDMSNFVRHAPDLEDVEKVTIQRSSLVDYRAPSNEIEEKLAEIWIKILGIDQIGVDDDFWDLGGDSISAIQIMTRIRAHLGARISPTIFFGQSTIAKLAKAVKKILRLTKN